MDWWYPPAITTGVPATKQPLPFVHTPIEQVWPAGQPHDVPHTLASGQQPVLRQVWLEEQPTQAPLDGSQV
jgi:hypothetical protein